MFFILFVFYCFFLVFKGVVVVFEILLDKFYSYIRLSKVDYSKNQVYQFVQFRKIERRFLEASIEWQMNFSSDSVIWFKVL